MVIILQSHRKNNQNNNTKKIKKNKNEKKRRDDIRGQCLNNTPFLHLQKPKSQNSMKPLMIVHWTDENIFVYYIPDKV